MLFKNLKLLFLLFACCVYVQSNSYASGAYDTVVATTIGNENESADNKANIIESVPTFNDQPLPDFSNEENKETLVDKISKKTVSYIKNLKSKKGNADIIEEDIESKQYKRVVDTKSTNIEDSNKFTINADKISYDETTGNMYAKGNVEIIASTQGVTLKSDEAILDKQTQTLKMTKNVKILKNGSEMVGDYLLVDFNEQNILMDNPTLYAYQFVVKAQETYLIENDIQMINGTMTCDNQENIILESRGFQNYEDLTSDYKENYFKNKNYESTSKRRYGIKAKEIVLTNYKEHNSVLFKDTDVYYNKHKIVANSNLEFISNKDNTVSETNAPEIGNLRNFGLYAGYGFVYKMPKGQTLKLMPVATYGNNDFGVGLIARHRSTNHLLEGGYNTSTKNLVLNGNYNFGHGFELKYGRNSYMSEGFMGSRKSGYAAQLGYNKSYFIPDLKIKFNHGIYAGAFSDYVKHKQESHAFATSRFRYVAEIQKNLFKYKNEEQDFSLNINGAAQSAVTVYGSGETAGVVRIGPSVSTKLKKWESNVGYFLTGIHGDSPFIFDKYRYGRSSIMFNEKFNFNNKFAIGYKAYINPDRDNYEKNLITESRIYAIFGPQDLKVCFSYDFVRDIAHVDFLLLIGKDSVKIDFEKLTTKDIDDRNKKDFYKSKPVKIVVPDTI